jgi:hypothetical protein
VKARHPGSASLLTQRLLALFIAGWALFDFPLLGLGLGSGPDATLFGLPRLPVLLFAGWAGLIVGLAWLMERRGGGAEGPRGADGAHGPRGADAAPAAGAGKSRR